MNAMVLAAGLGTRLMPLTKTMPKCLMPIAGKPLLRHWLDALNEVGIDECVINTHYLPDQVRDCVSRFESALPISLVHEKTLLGTAGTLMANIGRFRGDDVMIFHADNYCTANIDLFIRAFNQRPDTCLMSMMTFMADDPSSAGIVTLDDKNIVVNFVEKPCHSEHRLANAAIYIFSAGMLEILVNRFSDVKDISTELIPQFLGKIHAHPCDGMVVDIGSLERYEGLNNALEQNLLATVET